MNHRAEIIIWIALCALPFIVVVGIVLKMRGIGN